MARDGFELIFDVVGRQLPAAGVEFLVIGGHAVNHYGYSRATIDVDFMIASGDVATVRAVMKLFVLKGGSKKCAENFPNLEKGQEPRQKKMSLEEYNRFCDFCLRNNPRAMSGKRLLRDRRRGHHGCVPAVGIGRPISEGVVVASGRGEWQHSPMQRQYTAKGRLGSHEDDNYVEGSVSYRLGLVWPLTREVAALSPFHDPERRLQRHITSVKRRAG